MKRSLPMGLLLAGCALAAGCAAGSGDPVATASAWDTFWNAACDAATGEPSEEDLAPVSHFAQAGIEFDHPSVLRLRRDEKGYPRWTLSRGDVEVELHAPTSELAADDYLGLLAGVLDSDRAKVERLADVPALALCGRTVTPIRLRLTLFGDRHEMTGIDLPAPDGESRFLVFDDVLDDGQGSRTAAAAFRRVLDSLRCTAAR